MKVLIYGAGAIGGYLGSRIFLSDHQVVMLDRPEMADLVNDKGITIREGERVDHVYPTAVASLGQALNVHKNYDLIVMTLKSYDLPAALEKLSQAQLGTAKILTTGNGIGIEEPFIERFGADRIIAGSLTTPVSKEKRNHLIVERIRGLGLAPTRTGQDMRRWLTLFQGAGIQVVSLEDFQSMKWSKALLNMVSNATSAILAMPPGDVYQSNPGFDLEMGMIREVLAVMNKMGLAVVDLPGPSAKSLASAARRIPRFLLKPVLTRIVSNGRGQKMPSFYIDLLSGQGKSEVIYHNGAVVAAGQSFGIATPVNQVLNTVLLGITNQEINPEQFRHKPQRLYEEVQQIRLAV